MSAIIEFVRSNPDPILIFFVWLLAVVFLFVGYTRGREAWKNWFDREPLDNGAGISGRWVEFIMVSLTALLVAFVNQLTPAVPLVATLTKYWPAALGLFILGAVIVYLHSQNVAATIGLARAGGQNFEEFKRELKSGYFFYNGFSVLIFTFYVVAALAVIGQLLADNAEFQKSRAALDEALVVLQTWKFANTSSVIASIEETNSLLWGSIHGITEQINTVLLLFFFVLVINLAVAYTPIRAAYSEGGVWYTHCITALVLFLVIVIGWYLYYTEYLSLIRGMLTKLSSPEVRGKILGGDWEITQRYYALLNDLRSRQGITGFIITMCSERGGVLLFFYAITWFYDQRDKGPSNFDGQMDERRAMKATSARLAQTQVMR